MTEPPTGRFEVEKIALLGALLVFAVAVGIAWKRDRVSGDEPSPEVASANATADPLVALQGQVARNPADSGAWKELGEAYFNRGNFDDAVHAFEMATRISPSRAVLWSSLGEARVMASKRDPLPLEAVADFERAQARDKKDPRSRYFLAVKKDIAGDHKGAIADWLALLEESPAAAPWTSDLKRTIEQVGKINRIDVADRIAKAEQVSELTMPAAAAFPGPSSQDLAAASAIPPSQQRDMAQGMVARLEARLKTQPGNIDGWVMLMLSRMSLAQPDKAKIALRDALASNPAQADQLRLAAQQLGIHE